MASAGVWRSTVNSGPSWASSASYTPWTVFVCSPLPSRAPSTVAKRLPAAQRAWPGGAFPGLAAGPSPPPVLHPDGQRLPAHGAEVLQGLGLPGGQAHAAVPVAVPVVFALLGEELHRAPQAVPRLQGTLYRRVGELCLQHVGLPAQLWGEWASEWDTSCNASSWGTRPFMGGSEERPVSTART